jgi:adenylosuccinate lyase
VLCPESRRYVHLFATSADILDTANAMRLRDAMFMAVIPDVVELERLLIKLARDNAALVQIGRTHGKHAEPTTFGYAMALYVSRLGGRIVALKVAAESLRGKFSGAVGAYSAVSLACPQDPAGFEIDLLADLGLRPSDTSVSSQVVEPEYVTDLAYAVESSFGVLANLADDIRHLHRTEIGEVQESYARGDVGSSTMPHKVNPRNFENVKSMWKAFVPRLLSVLMDQISEHQRDLTNSASGRFVPELIAAFDISAVRMTDALGDINIDREQVKRNLEMTRDRILAEPLSILLALKGHPDAYDTTRRLIEASETSGQKLSALIWEDAEVAEYVSRFSESEKAILDDPSRYTGAAEDRTRVTCDYWELRIDQIAREIEATASNRGRAVGIGLGVAS